MTLTSVPLSSQLGDSSSDWGCPSVDIESYLDDMQQGHRETSEVSTRGRAYALDEAAELVLARMQQNRAIPVAAHSTQLRRPRAMHFPSAATASASGGGRRAPTLERLSREGPSHPPEKVAVDDVVFLRIKEKAFLGVDQERRGLTIAVSAACLSAVGSWSIGSVQMCVS